MHVTAILTAAGSGSRLGGALPKALVTLGSEPLVVLAARRLLASGVVDDLVVTVPADHRADFERALSALAVPVVVVEGGPTRQSSVAAGLAVVSASSDAVLVHDAARALTPPDVVRRVVDALAGGADVVVPVLPVTDSLVEADDDGARPVDRSRFRAVQTPQGFARAVLADAHHAAAATAADEATAATDDATLCARRGSTVVVVDGHPDALKITTPRDLALATLLTAEQEDGDPTRPRHLRVAP